MNEISDHLPEKREVSNVENLKVSKPPSVVLVNPGFKEAQEDARAYSKGADRNRHLTPDDRRNFLLGFLALVVLTGIFCLLEYKQSWDAKLEKSSPPAFIQVKAAK